MGALRPNYRRRSPEERAEERALVLGASRRIHENTGTRPGMRQLAHLLGLDEQRVGKILRAEERRPKPRLVRPHRCVATRRWCVGCFRVVPLAGFGDAGRCRCDGCDECERSRLCLSCRLGLNPRAEIGVWDEPFVAAPGATIFVNVRHPDNPNHQIPRFTP